MKYLTRFFNLYDKANILLKLKELCLYDFSILGDAAITIYCGYPTNTIDILLDKKPEIALEGVNFLYLDSTTDSYLYSKPGLEVVTLQNIKVQSLASIFNTMRKEPENEKIVQLIQIKKLGRGFVNYVTGDIGRNAFIVAYETLYGPNRFN